MATPSSLGSWDTPEHDELLLWISEHPEVIAEFIRPMMKDRFDSLFTKYRGPRFTYKTIQGYPVVGQNGYLHGKIDTIIEVHTELQQYNNRGKKTVLKDVVALIVDAKPRLYRMSATLDQINAYCRLLDFDVNYKDINKRMKVIITYDSNRRFDSMLLKQGIYVYHIQF